MAVNPTILKRDIDKWKKLTESIKNKKLDPTTDEAKAFQALTGAFKGNFNKAEAEKQIASIKNNLNKYAANRDLQAELKDFAAVCTIWLTKTEEEFSVFKTTLYPPEKKIIKEEKTNTQEDTPQFNPILLNRDVEKFRKLCFSLNGNFESLDVNDQSAFEVLSKYYNRVFDKTECEELISAIKSNLNKYAANRELQADLKDFAAICTVWYTKTNLEFTEFKKAMGGKERKPIIVEEKKEERKKPENKNTRISTRIDYDNGDYYIGEILNDQFDGKGMYRWINGNWYDGEWQNGVQHGKGKMVWTDGSWYDGEWQNGEHHGKGVYYVAQYQRTDTGTFRNNERSGSGKMVWANGNWYEGGWNKNGGNGKGTMYYKDMKRTDIGDFVNHERNGRGVMKWDSGERYEGTWFDTDNGLQGEGIYYDKNGYSEHGRYVNGNWQSYTSGSSSSSNTNYEYSGSRSTGQWIWDNLMWLPWVITAIAALIALVTEGFWTCVGICIGGGIASFILMYVIEIAKAILKWLWKHWWIVAIIVVVFFGRSACKSCSNTTHDKVIASTELPVLVGEWNGTFDGKNATLNITDANTDEVNASISVKYKDMLKETLKGTVNIDRQTIHFDDVYRDNGNLDGQYNGTFNDDFTELKGTYQNYKTKKEVTFSFTKDGKNEKAEEKPQKTAAATIAAGTWRLHGRDFRNWTGKLVIKDVNGNTFNGYIDWYDHSNSYENFTGKEYFNGKYDSSTKEVTLQGTRLENASGLVLGYYSATLSENGKEMTNGTWRGAVSGTWKAALEETSKQAQNPQADDNAKIENLKKTFTTRPQAQKSDASKNLYVDRVTIENGLCYLFFTGSATGDGGDGDYAPFWNSLDNITLTNLDNPSQTWHPVNKGEDENFTKVTTGFYLVFEGVTGTNFSLKGSDNYVFEKISFD